MILFLTYHKVSSGEKSGDSDFYTVTRRQLKEQFEVLKSTGRKCVSVSAFRGKSTLPQDNFILSFDDGTIDHFEIVMPLLQEHGLTATFFVPTAKLNKPGYITDAHVSDLARAGHCIGLHSHEHRRLDIVSDDFMRDQISRSRNIVGELTGEQPWLFAPPGGFMNEHVREVALGYGAEVIRTMRWGYNDTMDRTALETIPINRHTDHQKFQKIVQFQQKRYLYFGKQAMKSLVPATAYEKMRALLFKLSGRN